MSITHNVSNKKDSATIPFALCCLPSFSPFISEYRYVIINENRTIVGRMGIMNFAYLEDFSELSDLLSCCRECAWFARSRADISITAARKATEYIIKLMYGTRITPNIQGLTLFDMLTDYDFVDYIGNQTLLDAIHLIRKKGNQAVHAGNTSIDEALIVLEKLHYVIGEICIKLGVIKQYPSFDPNFEEQTAFSSPSQAEPEVNAALLQRITDLIRRRMKSADQASTEKGIVNIHTKVAKGIDPGANGKTAYQHLAKYLSEQLPDVKIFMENIRSELVLINGGKETVVSVKTGCSNLGTKGVDGNWEMIPGVDYVLYAPDVTRLEHIEQQFRLFTREEFVRFWEELELLRYKVSTAKRKRLLSVYGADFKIMTDAHADVISIQSFTNSGKKGPLVMQKLTKYPQVSTVSFQTIL